MIVRLGIYSAAHFFVDFSSALFLYGRLSGSAQWYACLLVYNFCAFALQMPLGVLADRYSRPGVFTAFGCTLIAATGFLRLLPLGAAALIGLGNALFHIGGGVEILRRGGEKAGPLGVFVSPGALGLYVGTAASSGTLFSWLLPGAALLLFAAFFLLLGSIPPSPLSSSRLGLPVLRRGVEPSMFLSMACLFLVVCLRSYGGFHMSFSWKALPIWGLLLSLAPFIGKALGGLLGDCIGPYRTAGISLTAAAGLFLFSSAPLAGVLAVFLFQMTMPLTLWALARLLPGREGFAFGALTFALFLGFLPVYVGGSAASAAPWTLALLSLVSFGLMCLGLCSWKTKS